MNIFEVAIVICLCISGLMLVRNSLVFNCRERARKIIFAGVEWEAESKKYLDNPNYSSSYNRMVLDLRKWTFAQFFPELAQRTKP